MSVETIQDHQQVTTQNAADLAQEVEDFRVGDVAVVEIEVEAQTAGLRRNRESRDRREAIMAVPNVIDGRLSLRRPGATNHGLQHEDPFVDENHATPAQANLFFYWTTSIPPNPPLPGPPVPDL